MGQNDWTTTGLMMGILALSCAFSPATRAGGGEALWISNAQGSWFETGNWVDGQAPRAGLDARFGVSGFEDPLDEVDIDNAGNGVQQDSDALIVIEKVRFFDSSAGGDPSLADDGLAFDVMRFDGQGGDAVIVDVPITARSLQSRRHGAIFNREITAAEILAESSHQDQWQINGGATAPIALVRLDEDRGPDGDTIDGQLAVNTDLEVALVEQVWGRLVVGTEAILMVRNYIHHDYSGEPEFSNINPIRIDGTLQADDFRVFSVTSQSTTLLPPGTHGRIGHASAEFEQEFITGDGLLVVLGRSLFSDRFEPAPSP